MRMMVVVMRVVGDKDGEGGMAMAMIKRMAGKHNNSNKEGSSNGDKGGGQG
jgi:hypothetical protein